MSGITIYVEGGGDYNSGRQAMRTGMGRFLEPLRTEARKKHLRWRVVACGSRGAAFDDYRIAKQQRPDEHIVLLVDAEDPVTLEPYAHLGDRDGWALDEGDADAVHLMVQVMETWLVSDPATLATDYGQGFRSAALPQRANLEEAPRADVVVGLEKATKDTRRGRYVKRHGFDLIGKVQPDAVRKGAPHCDRLFVKVLAWIAAA